MEEIVNELSENIPIWVSDIIENIKIFFTDIMYQVISNFNDMPISKKIVVIFLILVLLFCFVKIVEKIGEAKTDNSKNTKGNTGDPNTGNANSGNTNGGNKSDTGNANASNGNKSTTGNGDNSKTGNANSSKTAGDNKSNTGNANTSSKNKSATDNTKKKKPDSVLDEDTMTIIKLIAKAQYFAEIYQNYTEKNTVISFREKSSIYKKLMLRVHPDRMKGFDPKLLNKAAAKLNGLYDKVKQNKSYQKI